jgi:hypothetical protein
MVYPVVFQGSPLHALYGGAIFFLWRVEFTAALTWTVKNASGCQGRLRDIRTQVTAWKGFPYESSSRLVCISVQKVESLGSKILLWLRTLQPMLMYNELIPICLRLISQSIFLAGCGDCFYLVKND